MPLKIIGQAVIAAAIFGGAAGSVFAQAADPTKPAPAWLAAQARGPGQQAVQAPESSPADASIVVSSGSRRFVVIDGHVVKPGETYNGAKLLSVGDAGGVWQKGGVRESPSMSPSVQKTAVASAGPRARKKHKNDLNGASK